MDDERSVAGGAALPDPDQRPDAADHDKDPAEQEALARDLGEELTDLFARYVRGEVDFADLSFAAYDMLQDLHIIASGAYELEYEDDESSDDSDDSSDDSSDDEGEENESGEAEAVEPDDEEAESGGTEAEGADGADYDVAEATEEQEELAQEPSRP